MDPLDVVVVGAGAAGIGISAMLIELGLERMIILERKTIGASFKKWPKEMKLITPSFTTNFFGHLDLNATVSGTSPAYSHQKEHLSGKEYAEYLETVAGYYNMPIVENVNVKRMTKKDGIFQLHFKDGKDPLETKNVIWAAGEFQYPEMDVFPGSKLCKHNSKVSSWKRLKGEEFIILGGYESGIDAAVNLSKLGKKVTVMDSKAPWKLAMTDPSLKLSPYTLERLREEKKNGRIKLLANTSVTEVCKEGDIYKIFSNKPKAIFSKTQPILATGFKSSLSMIEDLFDWHEEEAYALINEHDESTKTPGLFLVGPQVRHENLIFCFIYKYRQRFGVVANAIGQKLGLETSVLENHRNEGLYLDDLSCCGQECSC